MSNYVNPANAVTASRFLCIPPYIYCVANGYYQWATVVIIVCGLFDKLDGAVAKKFNCTSSFGEIFDAIADGVCYGTFFVVLAAYGWVPWPPIIAMLGLGVVNTVMRGVYSRRLGRAANYHSFAMERVVGYVAFIIGAGTNFYQTEFFFYSCAALMFIVVVHDAKRMLIDPVPA